MRWTRLLLLVVAAILTGSAAQPAPEVPAEFQDLLMEVGPAIRDFRKTIYRDWDHTRSPVAFGGSLLTAHAGLGAELLTESRRAGVRQELDGLKALGVKAVSLDLSFPVLHPPFHQSPEEYQQYLDFYTQLAEDVRARGLKLIVKTQALFTQGSYTNWDVAPYYASLTLPQYQQGRMEVARTIATYLRPDYLSVIQEPDTEAEQTGKPELGTVEGSTALLNVILGGLQAAGVEGVAVGAGVGTWQTDHLSYVDSFASTAIDFVDMHVYAVNRDYLPRALEIADVARSHGKRVGMSDTWVYKVRDAELDVIDFSTIFARDVFGFWAPLDAYHLQVMVELAHYKQLEFMSAFWALYFRGYIDYDDSTKDLPPAELNRLAQAKQRANVLAGIYSNTGFAYRNAILESPDATPPGAPPNLAAQLTSATGVALTWSPAEDNVGTAVYVVFRDGIRLTQTAVTNFSDSNLSDARQYVYAVIAIDASGNRSPAASVSVTTPDTTAPSIPADLTAAATLAGPRIDIGLSWSPSTDNVGVTTYRVYAGTSPDNLSVMAHSTTTSFSIANAPPETTYYFAVSAADALWNDSGRSATAVLTTPAIPDTTPPTVNVPYPEEGSTISRDTYLYAVAYDLRGGQYDLPSGPAAVQFRIDGINVGPEQTVPYEVTDQVSIYRLQIDTRSLPDGQHVITAVARDNAGNVATSGGVSVTVNN